MRVEKDSIGTLNVPEKAYYGVQTLRGYENFRITGRRANPNFIYNVIKIKKAAAMSNFMAGAITLEKKNAIVRACDEALDGNFDEYFITDAVQGGAGTTFNMNVNEVIANRATELLGGKKGEYLCHPNDDVNKCQSTNDVIPTAGKMTLIELFFKLKDQLILLEDAFGKKSEEFNGVIKMGRTQLQDAVPMRLGSEFNSYRLAIKRGREKLESAISDFYKVNMGGSAIGTSINVSKIYLETIFENLSKTFGYTLNKADDLIDCTQNLDGFAFVSGALKTLAVSLSKISNDLRLMSSGPKTGLNEIILPAKQNGSSIMPGKVNPVIPEVVNQVAFLVMGNDLTISMACEAGQLELNAFEPVIFDRLFESFSAMTNAVKTLTENCVIEIQANKERCKELLLSSVGIATALCPYLGYQESARIAKLALKENRSVKEIVIEENLLPESEVDKILDPERLVSI